MLVGAQRRPCMLVVRMGSETALYASWASETALFVSWREGGLRDSPVC